MNDCELSDSTERYGIIKKKNLSGIKKKKVVEHYFKDTKKRYIISIYKSGHMKCMDGGEEKKIYYEICTIEVLFLFVIYKIIHMFHILFYTLYVKYLFLLEIMLNIFFKSFNHQFTNL